MDFPISRHNRYQKIRSLSRRLLRHTIALRIANAVSGDKRRVTVAIRCINQIARDLMQTNARPIIKGKK